MRAAVLTVSDGVAAGERRRRADAIREHVRAHDIREWIDAQLADLDAVRSS